MTKNTSGRCINPNSAEYLGLFFAPEQNVCETFLMVLYIQ